MSEELVVTPEQHFQQMEQDGSFDIAPCETQFDFEDKNRFVKLQVTNAQKMHMSALVNQLPNAVSAGMMAQSYCVSFPAGLPHTLTALQQGGYGSMVSIDGRFAGSASFHPLAAQAAVMGAFTAMSVASGQYFLAQINNELSMMKLKMDKILEFLYGDKKAELLAELNFVKYAYENYNSIMAHNEQRVATIISIQEAKKVAMKDIEFYMGDLNGAVVADKKEYPEVDKLIDRAFQVKDCLELSMQLYVLSSIMEMYFAQNHDSCYADCLDTTMTSYIDKCEKRMLSCFSTLNGRFNEFKGNWVKKVDTTDSEQRVAAFIDTLNAGGDSDMKKSIKIALHEANKKSELYVLRDGSLYVKAG